MLFGLGLLIAAAQATVYFEEVRVIGKTNAKNEHITSN